MKLIVATPVDDDSSEEDVANFPISDEELLFIFSISDVQNSLLSCIEKVDVLSLCLAFPVYKKKWLRRAGFTDVLYEPEKNFMLAWKEQKHWHWPSSKPLLSLSNGIETMIDILHPDE